MGSSLSERIAKTQKKKKVSDNSKNKVAFFALKVDIENAISDGWSNKAIWETLLEEGKISFSYNTFCTYVSKFIASQTKPKTQDSTKEDIKKKSNATNEIKGFTYNPIPNLEELL